MKVFFGWSGESSKEVAEALQASLPQMIQNLEPFISELGIQKGDEWFQTIKTKLHECDAFIACVTQNNLDNAIWMYWEAGFIASRIYEAGKGGSLRVNPYLFRVTKEDLKKTPLGAYQATDGRKKKDVRKLVLGLNAADAHSSVPEETVDEAFGQHWPALRTKLNGIECTQTAQASMPSSPSERDGVLGAQYDAGPSDGHAARPRRRRSLGVASQVTRSEEYLILDISETGAFLESRTPPIPDFTPMELNLNLDGRIAEVSASVVRVQKPDWGKAGGIGVQFEHVPGSSKDLIRHYVYADGIVDQG